VSEEIVKPKKTRKRGGLNLIDVMLTVLLILIIGAFLAYRFFVLGEATKDVYLEYSVEILDVGENMNSTRLLGQELYTEDNVKMGTVVGCSDVSTKKRSVIVEDRVGKDEEVYYITVTIGTKAVRMKDGSYRVDGMTLTTDSVLDLLSNEFALCGTCIRVSEVIK